VAERGWAPRWLRLAGAPLLAWQRGLPPVGSGKFSLAGPPPPASEGSRSPSQLVSGADAYWPRLGRLPGCQRGECAGRCLCRRAPRQGQMACGSGIAEVDGCLWQGRPSLTAPTRASASGRCSGRYNGKFISSQMVLARRQFLDAGEHGAPHLPQLLIRRATALDGPAAFAWLGSLMSNPVPWSGSLSWSGQAVCP